MPITIVLLPGLDGTGDLFARFVAAAPPGVAVKPMELPRDRARGYSELVAWLLERLPSGRLVLVAESFSGPLAVLVAAQCERVVGVALVATFIESPLPTAVRHLPPFIWRHAPPEFLLRVALIGGDVEVAAAVRRALRGVDRSILAARVAAALSVDVARELQNVTCPVLYIQAARDWVVGARCAARVRAVRPDTQFVRIDGPHLLLQVCPDEAWVHVKELIERVSQG